MLRLFRLLPVLALCACVTLQGRANELARQGQFLEAAALYDQLIRDKPNDPTLVAARDELRWRALEQLLGNARRHRLVGDDEQAEHFLERFLEHRAQWGTKLNGALESSLLEEMEGTHLHLRRTVIAPARRGMALTAEEELDHKRTLLAHPELAPIRREMDGAVLSSGKGTCARLKQVPAEGSPHWAELVARYCGRWHEAAPEPPPLPELFGAPSWSTAVEGLSPAQLAHLQARLARAFEASAWYSPRATRTATFTLQGHFSTSSWRESVRRTAPWMDSEPYTDHEERTETYQEPYTEEEEYVEEGEKKKRKVTKYRTKTRSYTVPVTRYRDVPRTFEYSALRHSVAYRFSMAATGVLVEQRSPLTAALTDQLSAHGYEHDVSFPPGDVSPERASLPETHGWFRQQVHGLERVFAEQLAALWREAYCSTPALTLEAAARCARVGDALPAHARQVLSEVLGEDAARAPVLFAAPSAP